MEYGYDVELPKIYENNRREYTNLTLSNKKFRKSALSGKQGSTPSNMKAKFNLMKNMAGISSSAMDNRPSNLATLVPNISLSNSNILETAPFSTK